MAGTIYKRCTSCGRKVSGRSCEQLKCERASVTWAFSVSLGRRGDGSRRRVLRSGFATKREAQAGLDDARTNSSAAIARSTGLSFADYLVDRWLPRTRTTEKTRRDREQHMRSYVIPRLGATRLVDISGDLLTEMYDDLGVSGRTTKEDPLLGWGLSATTIRRIHTQLNKAFNDAVRWGLLQHNPCVQADPPSTNEVKARALAARTVYTWDQLRSLLAEASSDRLFAMWHLFTATGMRRSEVAALRWDHVDLHHGMISVVRAAVESQGEVHEHEIPKSSKSRRAIDLDEADIEVLRRHQDLQAAEADHVGASWRATNHVFTSPVGGRLYPPDITRWLHELTDRARLPRIRLHDLRHTHATLLLKAGVPAKVVTERLGHSTTAYTQDAYQHVMPGMQHDAARLFHQHLDNNDQEGPQQ